MALWVLCEIAIAACDLAEVLGAAIGLNLLFGIPLLVGRAHHRRRHAAAPVASSASASASIEAFILALVTDHRRLLRASRSCWPSRSLAEIARRARPAPDRREPVRRHRHPRRDRDAAQPLPALGAGADAPHRRRPTTAKRDGLPLQPGRFGGRAERRASSSTRRSWSWRRRCSSSAASWSPRSSRRTCCWRRCWAPRWPRRSSPSRCLPPASPPPSPAPWPARSSWKASSTSACGPGCAG